MKKGLILIISVIFLFNPIILKQYVFAEEALQKKLDFSEAVRIALENNNEVRAMKNSLSAVERDIGIARSYFMPKITFGEDFMSTNNPGQVLVLKLNQGTLTTADLAGAPNTLNNPGNITNFLTDAIIEQPIYNRKLAITLKMAKKEYSASGYFYLRKQEELMNNVFKAYIGVGTTYGLISVAEQNLADAKEHLKIAQFYYKNKSGLYSDVLQAQTEVTSAEQTIIFIKNKLSLAQRALGLLLGTQEAVDISNSIPPVELKTLEYYKDFSMYRNDVKAMEIKVENAKNNIKLAQAGWYPTLSAMGSYNLYNSNYPFGAQGNNYVAGAFFRWELFEGNKRIYETRKARDIEAEAKERLEGLRNLVSFKVFESYSNVEELKANLQLAISAQKSAEEGAKLILQHWQNSTSPFVDLINAQANLDKARTNVIKAHSALKSEIINLAFESGVISKELGLE